MKREYFKPEVEFISFLAKEEITSEDIIEGNPGSSSYEGEGWL